MSTCELGQWGGSIGSGRESSAGSMLSVSYGRFLKISVSYYSQLLSIASY